MSRGKAYLSFVEEKLEHRIKELQDTIDEVQKDIEGMNAYYWENYTEMDQYGYENFDNQQALLAQVNAKQEHTRTRRQLKKMIDSPFFGSVDFIYDGENEAESFYIGIGNFAERTGSLPLIYDWRAPVSSLFYDYDKGAACYEAPGGIMEGEIASKWQYKIRRGKMVYEFESDVKIDDDILKEELGNHSDHALKSIVRTIQKEQNAIIRNTKDKILAIQGAAGSGKTSVALHRIAYLLYHDRKKLKSSNILILSPNSVFSDYISHILPELGEEHIREMSFDLFAYHELKAYAADCQDRYHYMEEQMWENDNKREQCFRWKQSEAYIGAVESFLVTLEDELMNFRDVRFKALEKSEEEILRLFYYKFSETPILERMENVMEYVVDEYETLSGRNLSEEELEIVKSKFMKMYETTDVYEIYNWILEANGLKKLPNLPREQRVIPYEDVYPILYLKYRLCTSRNHKEIRHLVIDEMQDYSYLQYVILHQMFRCNMTILGDRAQTIDDKEQDVLTFLPKIYGKEIRMIELKESYRNTIQIARYAAEISGVTGIKYLERQGKEVEVLAYAGIEEAAALLEEKLQIGAEGFETAAVLTMTEEQAIEIYTYLERMREDVFYMDRDSSSFHKGITVTTYYMAKGLEFDQVFVVGGQKEHQFYKQYQYICATRALHELYILDEQ